MQNINYDEMSDLELIQLRKENISDNNAFNLLLKRYDKLIIGKVNQFNKEHAELFEDLYQEAVMAFNDSILKYDENVGASFKTFTSKCIENQLINVIKKENNQSKNNVNNTELSLLINDDSDENNSLDFPDDAPTPEEIAIKNDNTKRLIDFIENECTEIENNVLILRLQDYSYKEIAKKLNIKVKDVDNIFMRLKNKIKNNFR